MSTDESSRFTCYACGREPKRSEWSREHVIPNALGGKWKCNRLLCRSCNGSFGERVDAALSRELGTPMNLLGLRRERKEVPRQIVTYGGHQYLRDAEGNLRPMESIVTERRSISEIEINVQAANVSQARQALERLANKYPGKIDVEEWMKTFTYQRRVVAGPTSFDVRGPGSDEMFRGVAKIALNAYLASGGSIGNVTSCLHYIRGQPSTNIARWMYLVDVMQTREPDEVAHVIALRARAIASKPA